jgi:sugar-specific transcriptional regulator TrmB
MKRHQVGGADLGKDRGMEAKRLAAAILEVLAGARTPTEAATALGLSVPRYYQVEALGLRGLLEACEPKPKGRVRSVETKVAMLHKENQRLQRELTRHQSLARAAQRAVGLSPPAVVNKTGKKPRKRRLARALSVAERLKQETIPTAGMPTPSSSSEAI